MEASETNDSLSPSSPVRSDDRSLRLEARQVDTSPWSAAVAFLLSSSEEVDMGNAGETAPSLSPQYKELVEVITRAVAKLSLDWPTERFIEPQRGKLDERHMQFKTSPSHRSLAFFPTVTLRCRDRG